MSCVSLPHGVIRAGLFSVCHLISLDESILGLQRGGIPGHFQDGGGHSWHSDRLRGHRWGCGRRVVLLKCCCTYVCAWAHCWVLEWEVMKISSTFPIRMGLRQYLVTPQYTYVWTWVVVHSRWEKRPYHSISSSPPSFFCLPLLTSHSSACDIHDLHGSILTPPPLHTHTHP